MPVVARIAKRYGKTDAQVLLRWNQQLGSLVITTTADPERQKQQLHFSDFTLTEEEIDEIEQAGLTAESRLYWGHLKGEKWDAQ